ncbi:NADPH-dependent FMN reductase [Microbacterium sp. 18062]|uniref:NADPH-dependent FMN reductase n=1 Tax=Microbacterium sp. 18062 TaxID=2681410 RepID=UPI00135A953C|nr:NAD(P)H-dependent oxidoreductase [Microbacterium sp. 18062]
MIGIAVVGNPKIASRTKDAAARVLDGLGADDVRVLELAKLGPALLGWGDPAVKDAVASVQNADVAVFASPTFKASYTGLLKLFVDQFAGQTGLAGTIAVPLMLAAAPGHALVAEYTLRPVLSELGATLPTAPLSLIDSAYTEDGVLEAWVHRWSPAIHALMGRR